MTTLEFISCLYPEGCWTSCTLDVKFPLFRAIFNFFFAWTPRVLLTALNHGALRATAGSGAVLTREALGQLCTTGFFGQPMHNYPLDRLCMHGVGKGENEISTCIALNIRPQLKWSEENYLSIFMAPLFAVGRRQLPLWPSYKWS